MIALYFGILVVLVALVLVALARRRGRADGFRPQRVPLCSARQDVFVKDTDRPLHYWTGENNRNWTAAAVPYDPDSKTQLFVSALTASASERVLPVDPLTRIGSNSQVLRWGNPFTPLNGKGCPCSDQVSVYDLQPFETGFMIPKKSDSTDGTSFEGRYYYQPEYWSFAAGPRGGPYTPVAACSKHTRENPGPDCDECVVRVDAQGAKDNFGGPRMFWWQQAGASPSPLGAPGRYASALAADVGVTAGDSYQRPLYAEASFTLPKETLRSRGNGRPLAAVVGGDACLTGFGCGLGSAWIDPRFEPGVPAAFPGGATWAHGGDAGGPTTGDLTLADFQTGGSWRRYNHARDGAPVAPCDAKK